MKCPHCHAELLPVDGEMFCLQCGRTTKLVPGEDSHGPPLEDTVEPVLQKAIQDVRGHPVKFRLPVSAAQKPAVKSFGSVHALMGGGARPALAGAGVVPVTPPPVVSAPVKAVPVKAATEQALPAVTPKPPKVVGEVVPETKFGAGKINLLPQEAPKRREWLPAMPEFSLGVMARPGVAIAVASVAMVVAVNIGIGALYANRVYPGVHVGQTNIGGWSDDALQSGLSSKLKPLNLSATVGGAVIALTNPGLGKVDAASVSKRAEAVGRGQWLPMLGLVEAWMSRPVAVTYAASPEAVDQVTSDLAARVDHAATPALPVVINGQAFVITDKAGDQLDAAKARAAIQSALAGSGAQFSAPVNEVQPVVRAGAFKDDIAAAQARMALSLKLSVRPDNYSPTAAQIGSWLVFRGPGKGVAVDGSEVAGYVASIPGRFDRAGAVSALLGAVGAGQNLNYVVASKVTATPTLPSAAAAWPLESVSYCLSDGSGPASAAESQAAASTLGALGGWALNGRLGYKQAASGCNVTLRLVPAASMGDLDPACAKQTTCNVGNQIEISSAAWNSVGTGWTLGLAAYRSELINHEMGHWLGFRHAQCAAKPAAAPILQAPTVVVAGCSPDWYEIDPNLQGTKVLPGF